MHDRAFLAIVRRVRSRPVIALTLAGLLMGGSLAVAVASSQQTPADDPASAEAGGGSKIVLLQGPSGIDGSTRTPALIENKSYIATLTNAIEGVTIDIPLGWRLLTPDPGLDCEQESRTWIDPLAESGAVAVFDHNLLRAQLTTVDIFDDEAAAAVKANWACLGALAAEAKTVGILLDTENYGNGQQDEWKVGLLNWDENSGRSLAAFQTKLRERFAQWVGAYMSEFPEGDIIFTRGSTDQGESPYDLWRHPENFEGAVSAMLGAIEGATTPQQIVDSAELYWLRTADEYAGSCDWSETQLPAETGIVPNDLLDEWASMPCGHGLYNKPWPNDGKHPVDARVYRDQIIAASSVGSVEYVWLFIEDGTMLDPSFAMDYPEWLGGMREAFEITNRDK